MYNPVIPCTTFYYPVIPCNTLYYLLLPCTTLYYPVLPSTTLYCPVLPCTTPFYPLLPCTSQARPELDLHYPSQPTSILNPVLSIFCKNMKKIAILAIQYWGTFWESPKHFVFYRFFQKFKGFQYIVHCWKVSIGHLTISYEFFGRIWFKKNAVFRR